MRDQVPNQILKEQVKQLYELAPLGFVATLVNSIIVFVVMKQVAPTGDLVLWLGCLLTVTVLRVALIARFRRADLDTEGAAATWANRFLACLALVGFAWGSIALFPFDFSLAHHVFIAFVLGGMAAGASSTFSQVKRGFVAFSVPALAPLTLHFLLFDDPFHLAMALMTLLFFFLLWRISQHNYKINLTSLVLRFENEGMIRDLKQAKHKLREEIAAKNEAEAELRKYQEHLERTVKERTADLSATNQQLKNEIEERKRVESALRESRERLTTAKDAAEAGNLAKSEFLANMSHEMRTPLAGVLGMIRFVLDMDVSDEERQLLDMARRSAESLLRIIGDVLDFARLESGEMKFEMHPFSVRETVRTAVEVVSLQALGKGLHLEWQVADSVQEVVADEGRLRQVLINLLGNAVKFTEKGRIDVEVSSSSELGTDGSACVLFSVRDTGVGISPDQLERIFGKFTQVDSSLTRKHGGTGLGLALSRQIVEKAGGRIWAESALGIGSTFHFTLPADPRNSTCGES